MDDIEILSGRTPPTHADPVTKHTVIDYRLRTTENNDVLKLMTQFHFDPFDFEWKEVEFHRLRPSA